MPTGRSTTPSTLRCPGPVSRRSFLEIGSLALTGLGLPDLLRLRAQAAEPTGSSPDTAVILVWLTGGLSHIDTYDMKPDAPSEYRGAFRPMRTNVPGIEVCEHLPLHAKVADRFTLIRSISHGYAGHDGAHKRVLTGRIPKKAAGFVNDAPAVGSIVAKMRENFRRDALTFTSGQKAGTNADAYSQGSAYLGFAYTPFLIPGDPSDPKFSIPNLSLAPGMETRLDDRGMLLAGLDRLRREVDRSGAIEARDHFHQKAFDLLTSDTARKAFDLSLEDPALRDRYGRHPFGQQTLLARRLVEAGTSFATVVMEHPGGEIPAARNVVYNWDCHAVNCHVFDDFRWRLPFFDQAVSALVEDIYSRGLDRKVMVVVTGEFGHTPRINYAIGTNTGVMQPGRDHWPHAMSMLVCGGGMRTGQVIGSTDARGERPQSRPLTPNDLWATVYHHLGIDPLHTFPDHTQRPMHILPFGEPIAELL